MFADFLKLNEAERAVHLLQQGVLKMMYCDRKVHTIETRQPGKELHPKVFDFLLDIKEANSHYNWRHMSSAMPDLVSPIDGEKLPCFYHKIYIYKEYI